MSKAFQFDVFLSHSSKDKSLVKRLATRLRNDGLRIWFDEWEVHPGDDIFLKVEEGLEKSRILILIISANAFGSDWVKLERSTALFRDPTNEQRRFIPLLIQDCQIPETIRRYRYIDWRKQSSKSYKLLLEACKSRAAQQESSQTFSIATVKQTFTGHLEKVTSVKVTPNNEFVLSGSSDNTLKLWDITSGRCVITFKGHKDSVNAIGITPDGKWALSASSDYTIKMWDLDHRLGREHCIYTFIGHAGIVSSLAIAPAGDQALSSSEDDTLSLWDIHSGECLNTFKKHNDSVNAVTVSNDGNWALSASDDNTVILWDLDQQRYVSTLRGHLNPVTSIVMTPDSSQAISGSEDYTIRLWDVQLGRCAATLEGHKRTVRDVVVSPNGLILASASDDKTIKLWELKTGACLQTITADTEFLSVTFAPDGLRLFAGSADGSVYVFNLKDFKPTQKAGKLRSDLRYTNAKVVMLGESGIGKSGLGFRLAENRWVVTDSTHGMRIWPLELPPSARQPNIEREVWLWDLAGQPEYRLVHQLFLDETALALVLFNAQADDPFEGLGDWEKALRMAIGQDPTKLLVAARTDRGGATITKEKIVNFCRDRGFSEYFETSAKLNDGCDNLKQAIIKHIPWERLPWTATTRLFKALKDAIVRIKDEGIVLIRLSELRQRLQLLLPDEPLKEEDLRTVVTLLAGQGLVKRLDFGDFILLQPEQLNNYASAVIRNAREHVDGIGCIGEQDVLRGIVDFKDMPRINKADEEILLRAMVQAFIDQSLCIREETPSGVQLVFPSQFNREIEIPVYPNVIISYRFSAHLPTIYTTLVVRLTYSDSFEKKALWKNAAEFTTPEGKVIGLLMEKVGEGDGEIKIFFEDKVPDDTRVTFIKYVHEHLLKRASGVERKREYVCSTCNRPVKNRDAVKLRLKAGKQDIGCVYCDARIPFIDLIERKFDEDRFQQRVEELDTQAKINLDNESRELILVGHAYAVSGEAGQIYRQYSTSEDGIDGEIEFKNNAGQPSGKKIYLQFKSSDVYSYKRSSDGHEVFTINDESFVHKWRVSEYPVYLVIRSDDGTIHWMNVTEYIKRRKSKAVKQIIYDGEVFTAYTLMGLRDSFIPPFHS